MKFKQVLASQRVKGWEDYYLDYKQLCKCIKADKARRDADKARQDALVSELRTDPR
jgi:SPX domain protein involved in polyphosphate accumulation